ncbi:hypothetical protein [Lacticaseibacillus mingshuiensis]|uniref:hypothetical protein n=1 Tax=Lacticaseibacillus mingshuiensis TaxID=2799574 RepID=UPI001950AFFA|nr:hypothetical protein [Lacticaseibacillus mingshuiensis]
MTQTDAQKRAQERYEADNRERRRYLTSRSTARSFIRSKATAEDLDELQKLIDQRRSEV